MSSRRSIVAPSNSYASVLAGQARLSSDLNATPTATNSRTLPSFLPSHYTAASGLNSQNPVTIQPATVPSYLTESLYAERLASSNSVVFSPPPLTPTSPLSLPGKTPISHRGIAYDVVERLPAGEEVLSSLPSRWSESDKSPSIELLNNGSEVRFNGPAKNSDSDAAAVRADKPMPPQCGLFYYEVTIVNKGKEGFIGIGFCTGKVALNKLPGWELESWGYHGDDGNSFCCQGCGVNFRTNTAFFTRNGHDLGIAFRDINKGKLYPVVGMKKTGEHVRVNFGQERFIFDIDHYMKQEKRRTSDEISRQSTASLCPPLDETALVQALVSQYLTHDGYVDTARAFAEDVKNESRSLELLNGRSAIGTFDSKSDADAVHRQRIRTAILEGDVDRALKLTNAFYPNVLKEKELLYFRLRRRKLVEMIRQVAETVHDGPEAMKNGNDDSMVDVFGHEMEIDDPVNGATDWDSMELEDHDLGSSKLGHMKNADALDAAVEYGQQLRVEFSSDTRPEIRKPLEEAFSLLAYTDPKSSVLAHLLDEEGRIADAEELNSAILVSLGKSSVAALERLIKQSSVILLDISENGGPGAFVNLRNDYLRNVPSSSY